MPATELSLFDLDARNLLALTLAACNTVPVLLPLALSEPYTYTVPDGEELAPGTFVVVPLGPMKRHRRGLARERKAARSRSIPRNSKR